MLGKKKAGLIHITARRLSELLTSPSLLNSPLADYRVSLKSRLAFYSLLYTYSAQ